MVTAKGSEWLLRHYSTDSGGFNPPIRVPTVHPLQHAADKARRKMGKEGKKGVSSRAIFAPPTERLVAVGFARGRG